MKKGFTIFFIFFIVILCSADDPIAKAELDAKNDINKFFWFSLGCGSGLIGSGIIGLGIAYVIEPSPPSDNLIGKDPEYIEKYIQRYKIAGRNIQTKSAGWGCVSGNVTVIITIILLYNYGYL